MSSDFWALKRLTARLERLQGRAGTVPCWTSVDYDCGLCPAFVQCRSYADAAGIDHPHTANDGSS
jgi:hypothetical protein